ncbi:MAG: hypothetical protein ACE361_20295 [Aureliella sp.]
MHWFRFSLRTLLAVTLVVAMASFFWPKPDADATDPKWRETILANTTPLENVPAIEMENRSANMAHVTATNTGRTTLEYRGSSSSRILIFQEIHSEGGWRKDAWTADGMCENTYEIAPGESVDLEIDFWDFGEPVRVLGKSSEKGSNRSGLVVLLTQEKASRDGVQPNQL